MELKVKPATDESGQIIEANYIISEIIDGFDALDNPIKMVGESGQHTVESIEKNIADIDSQIEALGLTKAQWQDKLAAIYLFLNK